jgi:hypothetical protein
MDVSVYPLKLPPGESVPLFPKEGLGEIKLDLGGTPI